MGSRIRRRQQGYALLVIMLALSVFVITLAEAMPRWTTQIRREREARAIDYGRQYREAIKRYFHKNGRYPASVDVLAQRDGNGLRYLRQSWQDPLVPPSASGASGTSGTGQQDMDGWQILHFGQAVAAKIVDQPPAAMAAAASGGITGPNLTGAPTAGLQGGVGGAAAPGGSNPGLTTPGTTTPGGAASGAGGLGGSPGTAGGLSTLGTGAMQPSGGGGGAVIGVAPLSKKPAIHAFNGFDIPSDWQFVYNFAQDPSLRTAGGATNGLTGAAGTTGTRPGGGAGGAATPSPTVPSLPR